MENNNPENMFKKIVLQSFNNDLFKTRYKNILIGAKQNNYPVEQYGIELVYAIELAIESDYMNNPAYSIIQFSMIYYKIDFYNTCLKELSNRFNLSEDEIRENSDSYF